MVKCLECGLETTRLQWTHFKYNCTGRFENSKEYKKSYPDAKLVDDNLAKRTAVTIDNMISKYGDAEGRRRWEAYRNKQAESNSYEYKKEKYGWSKEEFDSFNKSRSVTLLNLIQKHGEEDGTARWFEYCHRQAYTNTLGYFIEKYGEQGEAKFQSMNKRKGHSISTVAERHSCSLDEAVEIKSSYTNCGTSTLEYEIVTELVKTIGTIDYSMLTKQYCVHDGKRAYFYDIVHNKKAIEINGDYWHCNPKLYDNNYYHRTMDLLAEDIWMKDKAKIDLLFELRGIPALTIWESEYISDKKGTIEKCIKWLTQ